MILTVYHSHGELILDLEAFFPAKQGRVRELYKNFFMIGSEPASEYVDQCLTIIETKVNRIHENGEVKKAKQELDDLKNGPRFPTYEQALKQAEKRLKKAQKDLPKLIKNYDLLLTLDKREGEYRGVERK